MRKPVIAGNWKMYKLVGKWIDTAPALKPWDHKLPDVQLEEPIVLEL